MLKSLGRLLLILLAILALYQLIIRILAKVFRHWIEVPVPAFLGVTEFLIDPDYPFMSTTMRLGEEAGFVVEATEGNLWNYTVRFRKMP